MNGDIIEAELVRSLLGAFFDVYNYFGYGLAEKVYAGALRYELELRGHHTTHELAVAVNYKGRVIAWQRLDLVVDRKVIVEVKASEKIPPFAGRQLLNYLRATPFEVGLLLHFGPEPKFERFVDTVKNSRPSVREDARHSR